MEETVACLPSCLPFTSHLLLSLFPLPSRVGKEEGVDTEPFRHAVWHYIQSIKGIRRDDYNYKEVNKILTISFKTYIRMVRERERDGGRGRRGGRKSG